MRSSTGLLIGIFLLRNGSNAIDGNGDCFTAASVYANTTAAATSHDDIAVRIQGIAAGKQNI